LCLALNEEPDRGRKDKFLTRRNTRGIAEIRIEVKGYGWADADTGGVGDVEDKVSVSKVLGI